MREKCYTMLNQRTVHVLFKIIIANMCEKSVIITVAQPSTAGLELGRIELPYTCSNLHGITSHGTPSIYQSQMCKELYIN